MVTLTEPTPELRERLLAELGPDKRLVGMKMSAMGGSNPVALHSLTAAAGFVQVPPYEQAVRPNAQVTVGYVDLKALSRWLREVFGDHELASLVDKAVGSGEPYGLIAPQVQEYLAARALQIRDVDPESVTPDDVAGEATVGGDDVAEVGLSGEEAPPADPAPFVGQYDTGVLEELLSE